MQAANSDELLESDEDAFAVYDALFAPLVEKYGPLDDDVLSSPMLIFGMTFCMRAEDGLYVTYEPFHLVDTKSREGLRFALFIESDLPEKVATDFLSDLAEWVLQNEIGDGERIELSSFDIEGLPLGIAEISLFSTKPEGYGLYKVKLLAS